jgi:hypothetical protein
VTSKAGRFAAKKRSPPMSIRPSHLPPHFSRRSAEVRSEASSLPAGCSVEFQVQACERSSMVLPCRRPRGRSCLKP